MNVEHARSVFQGCPGVPTTWKYVDVRRHFDRLERSIDEGRQWAVFEPNAEQLRVSGHRTIEDFLLDPWRLGALLGDEPDEAHFVHCDRTAGMRSPR